jgi:hypothetical protein
MKHPTVIITTIGLNRGAFVFMKLVSQGEREGSYSQTHQTSSANTDPLLLNQLIHYTIGVECQFMLHTEGTDAWISILARSLLSSVGESHLSLLQVLSSWLLVLPSACTFFGKRRDSSLYRTRHSWIKVMEEEDWLTRKPRMMKLLHTQCPPIFWPRNRTSSLEHVLP